jgi:hypothetical protein
MPIWTKELDNTIDEQKRQIASLQSSANGKREIAGEPVQQEITDDSKDTQIARLTKENQDLTQLVASISLDKLFSKDDLYPITFRNVHVGDSIDLVTSKYDKASIGSDNKLWDMVDVKDKLFGTISYYKIHCNPSKKDIRVSHILFIPNHDADIQIVINKLTEIFGSKALKSTTDPEDGSKHLITPIVNGMYGEVDLSTSGYVIWPGDQSKLCK